MASADEFEELALAELRAASEAKDPSQRAVHLNQAAVYATKAERVRRGDLPDPR